MIRLYATILPFPVILRRRIKPEVVPAQHKTCIPRPALCPSRKPHMAHFKRTPVWAAMLTRRDRLNIRWLRFTHSLPHARAADRGG